ncbi:hypothetical protein [Candidatus Spyradosoma sp. SGI.093]
MAKIGMPQMNNRAGTLSIANFPTTPAARSGSAWDAELYGTKNS